MFGRTVKIDDREWFVFCNPDTPLSEVLVRAARQAIVQERERWAGFKAPAEAEEGCTR